ncbi:MAG TPA: hypothetical protein VMS93_03910 [Candidatus Saccharimonadales bacterium]|nr:hypothetical protein [Candidatus Saccharimonadales bacterium]
MRTSSHPARLPAAALLGAALLVPAAGCGLKAPAKPQWSVTLRVPLSEKSLSVADLAAHNAYLQIDSTGAAGFHWEKDLAQVSVGGALHLPAIGSDAQAALGVFEVNPPAPQDLRVSFTDIWPQAAGVSGQMASVPPLVFAPVHGAQSTGFQSAQVSSGTLLVKLCNGLPVPLDASALALANTGGAQLGTLQFPALAPGESTTVTLPMAGLDVSASWTGVWSGSSPGSSGPVWVDPAAAVRACFAFQGPLAVSAAVAPLPPQTVSWSAAGALPDSEQLTRADFTAGSLDLSLENHWGMGGSLRVTLSDFTGADGTPLTRTVTLDAARVVNVSFPMGGARYTAADPAHPQVRLAGVLSADGTGSRNVSVSAGDLLAVHASLAGASLSRVEGQFAPFRVAFDPVTRSLDLPDGLGPLGLADAGATITLTSTAQVPAQVTLQVSGTDAQGSGWTLTGPAGGPLTVAVPAALPGAGATGTLSLTGANSNLPEFLGHLPRSIAVTGYADVGDRHTPSAVGSGDTFGGRLEVGSALLASFSESRIALSPDSVHLSADTREQIRGRLTRVRLHAHVVNGLPLGADATLVLAASRAEAENPSPSTLALLASVAAAAVDPVSGVVTGATAQDVVLEISGAQAEVFQHDPVYVGGAVHLPGTAGRKVRVRAQDGIRAQVWLEAEGQVIR